MRWQSHSAQFKKLWGYSTGFLAVWTAHLGRSFGLFEQIHAQSCDRVSLSKNLGLDVAAVDAWCSAAIWYGLISERRGRLSISDKMFRMLVDARDEENIGGQFSYLALKSLGYGAMSDLFRSGKTVPIDGTFEAITNATEWDHHALLRTLSRRTCISQALRTGCDFLDVGCGTGLLLQKLAKSFPRSRLVGIDPSAEAVEKARRNLTGLDADIRQMDAEHLDFESRFDIVHMGEMLYSTPDKSLVLSNCHRALRQGGKLLIVEGLIPTRSESTNQQEAAIIFGMALDFALNGHSFQKVGDLKNLLEKTGFSRVRVRDLGGCLFLVEATRQ